MFKPWGLCGEGLRACGSLSRDRRLFLFLTTAGITGSEKTARGGREKEKTPDPRAGGGGRSDAEVRPGDQTLGESLTCEYF